MKQYADTICICGHWFEEHLDATGNESGECAGCDAGDMPEEDITHAFQYDPEMNTAEAIADRGGDPDKWPVWMKGYVNADTAMEDLQ